MQKGQRLQSTKYVVRWKSGATSYPMSKADAEIVLKTTGNTGKLVKIQSSYVYR
jgi:hypothetical protein